MVQASVYPQKRTNVRPWGVRAVAWVDRLSHAAAARIAEYLFTHPRRHPRSAREAAVLRAGHRFAIDHGGVQLAAWEWGAGPTVLLVHGWAGRASQLHAFVRPLVSSGFRVVAFDAPAHGASPGTSTTLLAIADAVATVVDDIGPVSAVIAHSLGAAAATIAMARGAAIARAVYVAPMSRVEASVERFADFLRLSARATDIFKGRVELSTGTPIAAVEGALLAPQIDAPLLVVHDAGDKDVPIEDAHHLVRAWSGARLQHRVGLGHHRILRDPETVAAALAFVCPRAQRPKNLLEVIDRELYDVDLRWERSSAPRPAA